MINRNEELNHVRRLGTVIKLKAGALDKYRAAHREVWDDVLQAITEANLRNYSIYHKDGWLFSYCEYHGDNYQIDMAKMAESPKVQEWWKLMRELQDPLPTRKSMEFWASMEEIFHLD